MLATIDLILVNLGKKIFEKKREAFIYIISEKSEFNYIL